MKTPDTSALQRALPPTARKLCQRLSERGFSAWLVGGCVRDILLAGLRQAPTRTARNDIDIATNARPDEVRRCFRRVIPTGIQHGTVTVLLDGSSYEVTTLRGETTYSDARHPDAVYFVDDIEADLARRDFTINAMAYEPLLDKLIDPFGGVADLAAGMLRAVGAASERFAEDGLRVLRAARFAATLQFELEPATAASIRPSLSSYSRVSPERIREEWMKALGARQPSRAFELMARHGLLEITAPELQRMIGFAVASQQDLWRHSLHCVDACPPRPLLRLAALLHDAGKPLCDRDRQPQEDPFEGHEQHGAELCELLLERLRFSNRDRQLVTALVRHHRIGYGTDWDAAAVRRWIFRVSPDLVEDLLALARADLLSKTPKDGRRAAQLDSLAERARTALREGVVLSLRDLAVNGNDLTLELGREPGAWLGRLLQQLLEEVVADPSLNCRDTLLARARTITAR